MAFRSRARRGWATLRAERRTLGQGLVALVLSTLAGFASGLTLAHLTRRLGTASAAGLFSPSLERGGVLLRNVFLVAMTVVGVTGG